MQLAQVLDKLMVLNNVSAYKMSKETGISDSLIGYWRHGDKLPGAENLLTISNYFGISVDYLLTGKEPQNIEQLTATECQFIDKFKRLEPIDQGRILERMDVIYENYHNSSTSVPEPAAPAAPLDEKKNSA